MLPGELPGGTLPDGRYEMRAVYADATQVLGSGGAWEATVSDGSIHSATASAALDALNAQTAAARALARQQIQEYALEATATPGTATFPECGSPVPQTNQPLTLTLKRPAMPSEAGEGAQSGLVTLRTTAGRSVVADVPRSGACCPSTRSTAWSSAVARRCPRRVSRTFSSVPRPRK